MSLKKEKQTISRSNERVDRYHQIELEKKRIKAQLIKSLGIDPEDEPTLRLVIQDILKGY